MTVLNIVKKEYDESISENEVLVVELVVKSSSSNRCLQGKLN